MESFHIVGAGGIGCAVGHALRATDVPVLFVDADPEKIECGRKHGVGIDGQPSYPASFEHFADWSPPPNATVLLCTKCYDNAAVCARLLHSITLIPIQNGFDPALESRGGRLEGVASFISECHSHQTRTRITRPGSLHLGFRERNGSVDEQAERRRDELANLLQRHGQFRVRIVDDLLPYKYSKLMYNAAISPIASAAGIDNGQLLSVPLARHLFFALLDENYRILRDAGVELGKIGPFHPRTVHQILARRWLANGFAWAFYPSLRKTYCSMAVDLPTGRTEIDFYNRHLIDLAGDRPCPLNRRVYEVVKRMERERIAPHIDVLSEFAVAL